MSYFDFIGYIGAVLLAVCGIPEAVKTYRTKQCSIGWGMLTTWYLGEILFALFIISTSPSLQALINYGINIIAITVIIYYKIKQSEK